MQTVTIRYGIESLTKTFTIPVKISDLRNNDDIRAALGYGDNVRFLIDGVEQSDNTIVPNGATVSVETVCNSKA